MDRSIDVSRQHGWAVALATLVGAGAVLAGVLTGLLGAAGCAKPASSPTPLPGPRIVSLSPAISRAVIDLGLGDRLVGRTPFCAAVDPKVPVVGDQQHVDFERLVRIRPTHVLVQPPATGVDPRLRELAEREGWRLGAWWLDCIDDVRGLVAALPPLLVPEPGPGRDRLEARAVELAAALARCVDPERPTGDLWKGRTLLICGLDPVTVFGDGTYLDEMLAALGARNATDARGWAMLSMEDVARLDPGAIVLVRETERPAGATARELLGAIGAMDIDAVRDGRLAVLDDPDAFLPSTGLPGVARRLESILRDMAGPAS